MVLVPRMSVNRELMVPVVDSGAFCSGVLYDKVRATPVVLGI